MVITIGITGGIGSGKSTACKIFKLLGTPVFEADSVAKRLYETNQEVKTELISLFGKNIYQTNEKIDRKKLASIIFNNDELLARVNRLLHPFVWKEFEKWLKKNDQSPYVIHEAAILFESGFYKKMNFTILVSAPEMHQISRVMERDGITEEMVRERMAKQWPEENKQQLADYILQNDNKKLIIPDIIQIDKNLKEYGKIW